MRCPSSILRSTWFWFDLIWICPKSINLQLLLLHHTLISHLPIFNCLSTVLYIFLYCCRFALLFHFFNCPPTLPDNNSHSHSTSFHTPFSFHFATIPHISHHQNKCIYLVLNNYYFPIGPCKLINLEWSTCPPHFFINCGVIRCKWIHLRMWFRECYDFYLSGLL